MEERRISVAELMGHIVSEGWSECTLRRVSLGSRGDRLSDVNCGWGGKYVFDGCSQTACTFSLFVYLVKFAGPGNKRNATVVGMCLLVPIDWSAVVEGFNHPVYRGRGLLSSKVSTPPNLVLFVWAS